MTTYDLGKVVGENGLNGATIWTTLTAPTTPNYTFTISNLNSQTGRTPAVNDIIIYSYYAYQISSVSSTTVQATNRWSIRGATGETGNGIVSTTKTGTSGLVDTYTITYDDGNTDTFTVTNGSDANVDIATSFGNPTSDSKVPSEKLTKTELDKKIAKSNTSGLMKNDGTVDTTSYSTFSGSYTDLSNKPTIPSSSSDLSDGSSLVKTSNTSGLIKNDGTIDTTSYISDVSGKINTSDIADNLTTYNANKVLSAKQGYNLKQWLGDVNEVSGIIGNPLCLAEPIYAQDDDFALMGYLVYASDGGKLCYLKTYDVDDDEIATMGDLNSLVGDAITYINQ